MFYVAEALLFEKGFSYRKHAGVHSAFGAQFAKTAVMDPKFHQWLVAAFNKRIIADYGVDEALTVEEIKEMIDRAKAFLDEAGRFPGLKND